MPLAALPHNTMPLAAAMPTEAAPSPPSKLALAGSTSPDRAVPAGGAGDAGGASPTFTPVAKPRHHDGDLASSDVLNPTRLFKEKGAMVSNAIILVEGNISAGKSTLCNSLGKVMGLKVEQEPTETNPYLCKYYQDPKRWAYPMQIWLLRQRYYVYLNAIQHASSTNESVLLDRSVFSDWVFAVKNNEDGNICAADYATYLNLRRKVLEALPVPTAVVYLRVSPAVCYDRVHKLRQRGCESTIPLEYLEGLNRHYESLVEELSASTAVIDVEWDEFGDYSEVASRVEMATKGAQHDAGAEARGVAAFAASAADAARSTSMAREFEQAVEGGLLPDASMLFSVEAVE